MEWDPLIPPVPGDGAAAPQPESEGCLRGGKVRLTIIRVAYEDRPPGSVARGRRRW